MNWRALWRTVKRPFIIAFAIFLALWLNHLISSQERPIIRIDGGTLGVAYHISYIDDQERNLKRPIDSLLAVIHGSLASYVDTSAVARINQHEDTTKAIPVNNHFINLFNFAKKFHNKTSGFLEPGIVQLMSDMPSYRYTCSTAIDSRKNAPFQKHLELLETNGQMVVVKRCPKAGLNFDAIAKGYAVDMLANFLESRNIDDYLIDIGGQILAQGTNQRNEPWQAGWAGSLKEDTVQNQNKLQFVLALKNEALASADEGSGLKAFRNRKLQDTLPSDAGKSTILLSTSVVSDSSCMRAQGWAIVYQFMGLNKSWRHVHQQEGISAYFIYRDSASGAKRAKYTENLSERLLDQSDTRTDK